MKLIRTAKKVFDVKPSRSVSSVLSVDENVQKDKNIAWEKAIPYKDVPGPRALPLLGNTWRFIPFIGDFQIEHIDQVSQKLYKQYGPIVKVEGLLGRPDMLFLFDPDDIEKVFRQEDVLPLRPSMPSLNYYKHVYRKDFFGDIGGVIAVHGENWQRFRSRVNQIMMQPRIAKMYIKPIEDTAIEFVDRIKLIQDQNQEMPDDFLNELHKWSLESIAKVALDVRLGCLEKNCEPDTQKLIDAINTFFINVPILELKAPFWKLFNTPTFKKYIAALDDIKETMLQAVDVSYIKQKAIPTHSLSADSFEVANPVQNNTFKFVFSLSMKYISKALKNVNKLYVEPSVLERVLALDNDQKTACILALDMFLVGVDTTSNATASVLYHLAMHPRKQDILYKEISTILPSQGIPLDANKLESMYYLKACIKETMRMRPVVIGNGRQTRADCVVRGYQIPEGVQVIFQHYVISNLEKYFPRSDEFIPERWMKECPAANPDTSISKNHHAFASLPFGFGKRMCLGRRFADLEMQTVIAKIIQNYKIEFNHEKLDYHIHPMYTPNGPLNFKFISRN